jgi:uncharacterized Zn-finger protein
MEEPQNKKFFKCNFPGCDMIFTKKCVLRDHQMAHKQEKPFKCEICGKQFTQRGNLKTHQKSHTTHEGFRCSFEGCGKTFVTNSYLKIHMKSHIGLKECICTYPGCGKKFYHRGNLKYHENKKHPDIKKEFPFECSHSKCNLKFKTIEEKMKHHYEAEPSCKIEKNNLIDLFCDMVNVIINSGDINAIQQLNKTYFDIFNKIHGKESFLQEIEKKNIQFPIQIQGSN